MRHSRRFAPGYVHVHRRARVRVRVRARVCARMSARVRERMSARARVRARVRVRVRMHAHVRARVRARMSARVRVRVRVHAHALCACDICVSLHVRVKFRDWKYLSNEKSFEMEHVSHAHTHTRATKNSAYTRQPTADLHGQHHTGSILDVWQRHSICISSISNLKSIC